MRDYPLQHRTIGRIIADKADTNGSKTWLTFDSTSYSYADLHSLTNRYANGFLDLGIGKSEHVAVVLSNCPEFLFTVWGLGKIGAVAVPLNTAAKGDQLRYFLEQSDVKWIVVESEFADRVADVAGSLPCLQGVLCLGPTQKLAVTGKAVRDLKSLERASDRPPPVDAVAFDDPAYIIYTSGTTGPSKGVVSPHSQSQGIGRYLVERYGYCSDDVLYACLPLFHVNALWYSCCAAMWADASVALARRFSASQFWDDIVRTGATQFNALGVMASMLLKQPPTHNEQRHRVRQAMVVPLSKQSYRDLGDRFRLQVTSLFAMTETYAVTIFTPNDPAEKGASAGHPRRLAEIKIADDDDQPAATGTVGEICVRPCEPWIGMLGYYKMPEATLHEYRNLWFHTGDRGYLDEDGYLWFVDRKKEAIRRRGENISAYEVEVLAAKHPDVLEVAAVAVASDLSEDEVMVYVVKRPGCALTEADLIAHCNAHMSYFMVPRYVAFIDALPKTASEKIEKYKLKQMAAADRATLWDREKAGIKLTR